MKVLGISSNYHDASSALVINGVVVSGSAEERFSLQKHDPSFPLLSARFCVEQAGITFEDLDLIVYHEDPTVKFSRSLSSSLLKYPRSRKTFVKSMQEAIGTGFWIRNEISKKFDVHPKKITFMPHHFSHAAHAFLGSPFSSSAILTLDAVGEWTSTSIFHGNKKLAKNNILKLTEMVPFPHSLGLVYSAFTAFLGFKVNDGECSTMALAAFGRPNYVERIQRVLRARPDGLYEVDLSYFDFNASGKIPVTEKFLALFGQPRNPQERLSLDCLDDNSDPVGEMNRYCDIACSLQIVLEQRVLALAHRTKELTGEENLCLGGGVALNCVANGKLLAAGIFSQTFIAPDPGDGGGAMGAALYGNLLMGGNAQNTSTLSPYLGKKFATPPLEEMLPYIEVERGKEISLYSKRSYRAISKAVVANDQELISATAGFLKEGKIVGWVQGRFENGPRALGARSILCDPSRVDVARHLSEKIKRRASFRPYACSVTETYAAKIFDLKPQLPHKWMLASATAREKYRAPLRAALHIDGSTRPQICSASDHLLFFLLLEEMERITGHGALLNTSFNESGFPMISSPEMALAMFMRTDMDILVIDRLLLTKEF